MTHEEWTVSTLTRPEGRVLPYAAAGLGRDGGFQPSPGPKAGCYEFEGWGLPEELLFQPSPGPKAGCYFSTLSFAGSTVPVSTLTRPEGRVLPAAACTHPRYTNCFNPHPARRPGATRKSLSRPAACSKFQPSPGPKAGCYCDCLSV